MIKEIEDNKNITIGFTHGDVNSTNYEMIINMSFEQQISDIYTIVLYGSSKATSFHRKFSQNQNFNFHIIKNINPSEMKKINVLNINQQEILIELGNPSQISRELATLSVKTALKDLISNKIDALVLMPVSADNFSAENTKINNQIDFIISEIKNENALPIYVNENIKFACISNGIESSESDTDINNSNLEKKLEIFIQSLKRDFRIPKPKVAVLSYNSDYNHEKNYPQESEVLIPVIKNFKKKIEFVFGPYSLDYLFKDNKHLEFDGIFITNQNQKQKLADQLCNHESSIFIAGLPFVCALPMQEVNFVDAGKGSSSTNGIRQAAYVANDIVKNRLIWDDIYKNPLPFSIKEKDS